MHAHANINVHIEMNLKHLNYKLFIVKSSLLNPSFKSCYGEILKFIRTQMYQLFSLVVSMFQVMNQKSSFLHR